MPVKLPYETLLRNVRLPDNLYDRCVDHANKHGKTLTSTVRDLLDDAKHSYNVEQVLSLEKTPRIFKLSVETWQWLEHRATVYGISINELIIRILFKEFEDEM